MKTKRIAVPVWADYICPVLDFARSILVVDMAGVKEQSRESFPCSPSPPIWLPNRMSELGVEVIICGALSYELLRLLQMKNITIIPYIQGNVHEVFNAYWAGTLSLPKFRLPGMPSTRGGPRGHRKGWAGR